MSDNCNDIVKEKTNGILGNIKTSQVNIYDGSALPALPSIISGTSSLNDVILAISQELTDINTAISNITFTSDVVTYEGAFSGCFSLTNGDSLTDVIDDLAQEICNTQALISTSEIKDTQVSMSAGITIPCWVSAPGPYNYLDDFSDAISDAMCNALSSITTIQNTYATTSTVQDTLDAAFDNFVTQGFVNSNVGLLARFFMVAFISSASVSGITFFSSFSSGGNNGIFESVSTPGVGRFSSTTFTSSFLFRSPEK